MKKVLVAAVCAAGLALSAAPASAVEFKPYGIMEFMYQMDQNIDVGNAFQDSADVMHNKGTVFHQKHQRAMQRLILGMNFYISENLSATYDVIAGYFTWGGPSGGVAPYPQMNGGALGTRSNNIITRQAYMDWIIPHTKIKVRMGLQNFYLPGFATGSLPMKVEFGTGIVVNTPITDNISATFMWQRAASGPRKGAHPAFPSDKYMDDTADFFALTVPVKGEGYRWAPNFGIAFVGKDSFTTSVNYIDSSNASMGAQGQAHNMVATNDMNFMPVMAAAVQANLRNGTTYAPGNLTPWWVGIGGEITMWDPFRFAIDLAYGATEADHKMYERGGFYGGIVASYKTKYGVPTLKAWYTTGDDSNIQNGSERPSAWAPNGANTGLLNSSGMNNITVGYEQGGLMGSWGLSLQWNNLSIVKDLLHSLRIAYFQGTNSPAMAPYARQGLSGGISSSTTLSHGKPIFSSNAPGNPGSAINYLTTKDRLIEIDFENIYSIYKNLAALFEVNYIITDYDSKIWGANLDDGKGFRDGRFSNAWRMAVSLRYTF